MVAIIPAKGKSTRLPDKHLRPFCGSNLLSVKIRQLLPVCEQVFVGTDSHEVADIATRCGAEVVWRAPEYSSDCTCTEDLLAYLLKLAKVRSGPVIYTISTCPIFDRYRDMVSDFRHQNSNDAVLFTGRRYQRHLWGESRGVNWSDKMPRTQELPMWWEVTHGAFLFRAETFDPAAGILGQCPVPFAVSDVEAIEIDYADQFELAEALYRQRTASAQKPMEYAVATTPVVIA